MVGGSAVVRSVHGSRAVAWPDAPGVALAAVSAVAVTAWVGARVAPAAGVALDAAVAVAAGGWVAARAAVGAGLLAATILAAAVMVAAACDRASSGVALAPAAGLQASAAAISINSAAAVS